LRQLSNRQTSAAKRIISKGTGQTLRGRRGWSGRRSHAIPRQPVQLWRPSPRYRDGTLGLRM